MSAIYKMMIEGMESKAFKADDFKATEIVKGRTVVCNGGMAHMRGHMVARCVRFTWTIDGARSSKAEVLKLMASKSDPAPVVATVEFRRSISKLLGI